MLQSDTVGQLLHLPETALNKAHLKGVTKDKRIEKAHDMISVLMKTCLIIKKKSGNHTKWKDHAA